MTDPSVEHQTESVESQYFDEWVRQHGEFNPFQDRAWNTLKNLYTKHVPLKNTRLLDVGCGTGHSRQIYIDNSVSRYVGLDLSQSELNVARKNFPSDSWVRANALHLPFAPNSFDVVAFSGVLHHIPEMQQAVNEAFRVLRTGGMAFAYDPNLLNPFFALLRHPKSPLYSPQGVSPNEAPLLPSRLRNAFQQASFKITAQPATCNLPYRAIQSKRLSAFLGIYNLSDRLLHLSCLDYWIGALVITVAQKPA
jgi:SAM-dependent methyltransferase